LAIIFTYRPRSSKQAAVIVAGGFDQDGTACRHQLLKELLQHAGINPEGAELIPKQSGQPCARLNGKQYAVSVSHTKGFLTMALTLEGSVGIDTEKKHRTVQPILLRRIISQANPEQEASIEPLLLWTLKESFLKMTGKGLRHAMNKVTITRLTPHEYKARTHINNQPVEADLISVPYGDYLIAVAYSDMVETNC